jgi:hypothetical protein
MPTGWQSVTSTPDTYSNDGSYGLPPSELGNFSGVTAFEGIRWVAGAAFSRTAASTTVGGESFGTTLLMTLTPGAAYQLDAHLYQALRSDLDNPGGYHLFLAQGSTPGGLTGATLLGALAPTTGVDAWEARSLTFIAPLDAGSRPLLIFAPYKVSAGNAYPGIDAVSLTATAAAVPEPASLILFALGGVGLFTGRRLRKLTWPSTPSWPNGPRLEATKHAQPTCAGLATGLAITARCS